MTIIIRYKDPRNGMYSLLLQEGEKLQFYRGRARRIPPNKEKSCNTVPVRYITSVELIKGE